MGDMEGDEGTRYDDEDRWCGESSTHMFGPPLDGRVT